MIKGILRKIVYVGVPNPYTMDDVVDDCHKVSHYLPPEKGDKHSYTEIVATEKYLTYLAKSKQANPWSTIERVIITIPYIPLKVGSLILKVLSSGPKDESTSN